LNLNDSNFSIEFLEKNIKNKGETIKIDIYIIAIGKGKPIIPSCAKYAIFEMSISIMLVIPFKIESAWLNEFALKKTHKIVIPRNVKHILIKLGIIHIYLSKIFSKIINIP
jgi:hypothetical protein